MSISMQNFNLDFDLFSNIAENPEMFESTGRTNTLRLDREVSFKGSINGIEVPASAVLRSAKLTRLTLLEQTSPNTGKDYFLVTGIMRPVQLDLYVTIDGQKMNLVDVLLAAVNEKASKQITRDQFLDTARKIGLNFTDGMPFFFQQFGANLEGWTKAREAFVEAGAKDVIGAMNHPGRIKAAYQHNDGVDVTAFEVGTVDRTRSRTGQGFLNLIDATVANFQRVVELRKEAKILKAKVDEAKGWSQEKIDKANEHADLLSKMSRQWVANWAGAQQRIVVNESGKQTTENIWDPVNAPCGRFTMIVNGSAVEVDLWSNSAKANTSNTSVGASSTNDEDAF